MNILEWVQDSFAVREVNRVSQHLTTLNESLGHGMSHAESSSPKGEKFATVVDSEEFSKRASETLAESSTSSGALWDAPEEEDNISNFENGCQDEQASTSLITGGSSGNIPFTLLGTGALRATEANLNAVDRVKSLRAFLCRPLSCMPSPSEMEETGNNQQCEPPQMTGGETGSEPEASNLTAGELSSIISGKGSPSNYTAKQEVTVLCAEGTESVTRKAIRESLQKRQAELMEASMQNYSDISVANYTKDETGSYPSEQSHFLNGRTKRVSELLKAAEAKFEARLNPSTVAAAPSPQNEADDEILA